MNANRQVDVAPSRCQTTSGQDRVSDLRAGRGTYGAHILLTTDRRALLLAAVLALATVPTTVDAADPVPTLTAQRQPLTAIPRDAGRPEASPNDSSNPLGVSPLPNQNTTGNSSTEIGGPSGPISAVPRVGLFPGLGKDLLDAGFDFHGIAFDRTSNNLSAGQRTHETNNLLAIAPTLDVDLGKLAGIPGGSVHIAVTLNLLRANEPNFVTDGGGELVSNLQGTPALSGHFAYLSEFTYEQRLLKEKLSIEVGQTSVFRYFFLPNSLDPLTYYSTTFVVDGDFPTVPFPTWGGRAIYKFDNLWYAQAGVFEDNYRNSTTYPLAYGLRGATGAQILTEVGYRSEFSNAAYPANFEAGVEYNTRSGYYNSKGSPALINARLSAANYPGGAVFFTQGLQTIWRGAATNTGAPPANISFFGSLSAAADKPQPVNFDLLTGLNFTGLIPGRPADALGVQARWQRLSAVEAAFESRVHTLTRGPGPYQNRNGFAFEVVGSVQATPAFSIRPLVEYFIDPDNLGNLTLGRPKSGFEVGLFAVVSLGRALGTSTKPF